MTSGLCRDCGAIPSADESGRCGACASPRLLRHAELFDLTVAHLDCDAFYAAIETRDDPSLAGKPVLVGGRHRGVVAACSYEARRFGIHSAMPMAQALKRCPEAVVIPPNMKKYSQVGRQVRDLMRVDPVDGKEDGSKRIIAGSHYWAGWESVFFIQKAIEKSGWKSKKDTPDFIQALEGLEVQESFEHPQGSKVMRAKDHKTVIDFYMSKVQNGEIHVQHNISAADVESRFPARYDFTKESF